MTTLRRLQWDPVGYLFQAPCPQTGLSPCLSNPQVDPQPPPPKKKTGPRGKAQRFKKASIKKKKDWSKRQSPTCQEGQYKKTKKTGGEKQSHGMIFRWDRLSAAPSRLQWIRRIANAARVQTLHNSPFLLLKLHSTIQVHPKGTEDWPTLHWH